MAAGLSLTEEFLVLFNQLKAEGGSPERVRTFYKESTAIRDAFRALHSFLARTDLERRVFHGRKVLVPRAVGFEAAWKEYAENWRFRVTMAAIPINLSDDYDPDLAALEENAWKEAVVERIESEPETATELAPPDPEIEYSFDPLRHAGGAAIELGIEYLESPAIDRLDFDTFEDKGEWANRCSIALGAYDYLTDTIGLDVHGVFRRWQKVPVVFMPAHVSNRYGASDKGSLLHLFDDAVRAYVFGAPAAAVAMCRAALEMVLKRHYGHGQWENAKLGNLVFLASKQYDFILKYNLKSLAKKANRILHNYNQIERLGEEEERTILLFLENLKSLIERAPKP